MSAVLKTSVQERAPADAASLALKAQAQGLNFYYGAFKALKNLDMPVGIDTPVCR